METRKRSDGCRIVKWRSAGGRGETAGLAAREGIGDLRGLLHSGRSNAQGSGVCPGFRPQGDTAVAPPGGEGARGPVRPEPRAKTGVGSVQRTVIVDSDSQFFSLADVSVFFVYWSPVRQGFLK